MNTKIYTPLLFIFFITFFHSAFAQNYPTGFSEVLVSNNLSEPTNMAFAPDGRIFVTLERGAVRVIKNGVLLDAPFIILPVDSSGERGLMGLAFDPDFATNGWVYFYYTLADGTNNRIVRVKAKNDTAKISSLQTVLDLDPLSSAAIHNGGTIKFGTDGKLYVAVGDNGDGSNAQNLDTYLGKLLRINPNGGFPSGNPYPSGTAQKKRVWASGFRNPFTFDVNPITGKIFVNDVGLKTWEEVNDATTGGKNFGWPTAEGNSNNPNFTNPLYEYNHSGKSDRTGCAITGGAFFTPASTNYPEKYSGNYFFMDLCGNWINRLILNDSVTRKIFATNIAGSSIGLTTGPDGNLYFLSRDDEAVYKIVYDAGKVADKISDNLKSVNQSKYLSVYPTPANKYITIDAGKMNAGKFFIKLFDTKGRLVNEVQTSNAKTTINTSSLPNGFYFIVINNGSNVQKINFEVIH